MAHLVPNPPPAGYQSPRLTQFSITSANGEAEILAWGLGPSPSDWEYTVSTAGGWDAHIVCNIGPGPRPDLAAFRLRGVNPGDTIALFRNANSGTGQPEPQWVQWSGSVYVKNVSAAASITADFMAGRVPQYHRHHNIKFYPYGAMQRNPPMDDTVWMNAVIATLETIAANSLGNAILALVPGPTIIHPYIPSDVQAWSNVLFTPSNSAVEIGPGSRADEILLHELIHVIENNAGGYTDSGGFFFAPADFLTVNGTNVYSCLLHRALRKDHGSGADNDNGFRPLPQDLFVHPENHHTMFIDNYRVARSNAPALYNTLANGSRLWNPFARELWGGWGL